MTLDKGTLGNEGNIVCFLSSFHYTYSVTQSLSNSLLGDVHVVLDSFNIVYGDEDSILDQIYEKHIFSSFYSVDLKF